MCLYDIISRIKLNQIFYHKITIFTTKLLYNEYFTQLYNIRAQLGDF